jgi:hypothetical protein
MMLLGYLLLFIALLIGSACFYAKCHGGLNDEPE